MHALHGSEVGNPRLHPQRAPATAAHPMAHADEETTPILGDPAQELLGANNDDQTTKRAIEIQNGIPRRSSNISHKGANALVIHNYAVSTPFRSTANPVPPLGHFRRAPLPRRHDL